MYLHIYSRLVGDPSYLLVYWCKPFTKWDAHPSNETEAAKMEGNWGLKMIEL